jgi:transposase
VYSCPVRRTHADEAGATISVAELAARVSALQVQLVGVQSRMREAETQNDSLRETIVNLTHENQLLKRRIYGNKTERTQTSELQLSPGSLLDTDQQLQKQLDEAVAKAKADVNGESGGASTSEKPKTKPTGRRDLLTSNLPRFLRVMPSPPCNVGGCSRLGKTVRRRTDRPSQGACVDNRVVRGG